MTVDRKPVATLTVYRSRSLRRSQRWHWRLTAGNGSILADSGEGYTHRADAEHYGRQVTCGGYAVRMAERVG